MFVLCSSGTTEICPEFKDNFLPEGTFCTEGVQPWRKGTIFSYLFFSSLKRFIVIIAHFPVQTNSPHRAEERKEPCFLLPFPRNHWRHHVPWEESLHMLINMLAKAAVGHPNCSPQLGPGCETWRFFRALSKSKKHHKNQGLAESLPQCGYLDRAQNTPFLKITVHRLAKPSSVSLADLAACKCINRPSCFEF